jgi:hypothetical protein
MFVAAAAAGQTNFREPDPTRVRMQLGPVLLNPTLALNNAGLDTNVFNQADDTRADRDFTIALTPATDWWLRMGRTWLTGTIKEDFVWFQTFSSERSVNGSYAVGWVAPFNRMSFNAGGNWVRTRERPGFEIDERARRKEAAGLGSIELKALARTFFGVRGERRTIEFDHDELFLSTRLETELNRTITTTAITMRHQLTPLTSFGAAVGRQEERFDLSPLRDSDSNRYDFSLAFDPFALINGSIQIGFRDFKPLAPDVPGYQGSTANVNLAYVALGSTKVGGLISRDIQYSHDVNQPYYLQTGFSGSIAQQIYGPIDVEGRLGAQRLKYADRQGVLVAVSERVDRIRGYGFGVGYRLGRDLRVGFNIDKQRRTSPITDHEYEGFRYGLTSTYGL